MSNYQTRAVCDYAPCRCGAPEIDATDAHRTAIDLVLAHLTKLHTTLVLSGATPDPLIATIMSNVIAIRDWTPEHAAEVLRETKAK